MPTLKKLELWEQVQDLVLKSVHQWASGVEVDGPTWLSRKTSCGLSPSNPKDDYSLPSTYFSRSMVTCPRCLDCESGHF